MAERFATSTLIAALTASFAVASVGWAASWSTDPQHSKLSFVGIQAGAKFEGVFEHFTPTINFDPKDLANSKIDVTIDLHSVNSKDKERDGILRGPDLLATDRWPTAHYATEKLTDKGGGKFSGLGKLTIRDVTREVPIEFTYKTDAGGAWLKGSAKFKRLDFGVGQGEWKDTDFVANEVKVEFSSKLTP